MNKNIIKDSISCLENATLEDTTYQIAINITLDYLKQLEEENKKLKECYCNRTDCSGRIKDSKKYVSLQQRINKAIEYINDNVAVCAFGNNELPHWEFDDNNIQELLKILKGEENE